MRLKRLELFGFKSFADRTVLDFERSLTGIVGPNGCGKSNVVDAARWVLGEQRPTSMRGGEMTDVIFKGSASRPPLAVAEVTMVLDNADRRLEERGPEICVTRRVFKSGEGEYLIDGDRVRLKDVREMLFDTGLGSRGYAVLEQGKIDAVLSANPLERRAIFEEAAGISRYRQRKKEAESRLKRVEQDVDRLDDLIGELQSRSRSLKIQAGKAERYVAVRDAWHAAGERLARHRLAAIDAELGEHRAASAELEARAAELRALRDGAEADVATRESEQEALAAEVDRTSSDAVTAGEALRALDERRAQISARIHGWSETSAADEARAEELAQRLRDRREDLDARRERSERLAAELAEAEERLAAVESEGRELRARAQEARRESEVQNERVLGLLHEKTAAGNSIGHLEQALEPLTSRSDRATRRLEEARTALERAAEDARAATADRERLAAELEAEERGAAAAESALEELGRRASEAAEAVQRAALERERLESRIESLLDHQAEREGLEGGARALLEAVDGGEGPALSSALRGLVADHLSAPSEVARALDAALGDRAQALVVESPEDARTVLDWFSADRPGQVRLALPGLVANAASAAPRPGDAGASDHPGWIGPLLDHVRPTAGFEGLARAWLGDVVLVRDRDAARELAPRLDRWRVATPQGDLFETGAVLGGRRALSQGPIGRRSHAADLGAERDALEERLAGLRAESERLARGRRAAAAELDRRREALGERRTEVERARATDESAAARRRDLAESVQLFEHEARGVDDERASLERDLAAARERLARAEEEFAAENERFGSLESRRSDLEARREAESREEGALRVDVTRLREQLEGEARGLRDLETLCTDTGEERERALSSSVVHRGQAEEGASELEQLSEERVGILEQRGKLDETLAGLRERERGGREAIDELRRRVHAVTRELEERVDALSGVRLEVQRLDLERDELLRRSQEDHDLDAEALARDFEPDPELAEEGALEALAKEVHEHKAQLDKLGPVNVEAVEELEEVSGRLDFLVTQRADLAASRASLENTLRTINEESERRFLEAFEEIRGHFQRIFRQLFGGGRADVTLQEDVPPLEAGIEIVARPPGREMLPIGLLSGGQRTLTALALLFSVFQSRPSPFCVLDEVDAALDDANVGRFLGMIDAFRRTTQFVVVTHNKGTMAACDMLHGVTMETKGVSRQVTVELSDVDAFVPEVRGSAEAGRARPAPALREDAPAEGEEPDGADGDAGRDEPSGGPRAAGSSTVDPSTLDPSTGEPVVELRPGGSTAGEESSERDPQPREHEAARS